MPPSDGGDDDDDDGRSLGAGGDVVDTGSSVTSFPCTGCDGCGATSDLGAVASGNPYHTDDVFHTGMSDTYAERACRRGGGGQQPRRSSPPPRSMRGVDVVRRGQHLDGPGGGGRRASRGS